MSYSFQQSQNQNSLSKYEVVKPIGRGAGSFVYKIKERKTGEFAALKVIEKKNSKFAKIRERILNEIEVHSKLDHENIVKLLTHFEDEDNYYIMLELCEGPELYSKTKAKGRLSEEEVRFYGFQFAKGLKYLHENRILHRDLKLSNLLVTEQQVVKICDFGLSVCLTDLKAERDTLCGTPNYLAPELVNQEPYGLKADCWAFGCILYTMATGAPPFEGQSIKETLLNVRKGEFNLPNYLSKELQNLLKNLINWDPQTRFDIQSTLSHPFFAPCLHQAQSSASFSNGSSFRRTSEKALCINGDPIKHNDSTKLEKDHTREKKVMINHTKNLSLITPSQAKISQQIFPMTALIKESKNMPFAQAQTAKNKENDPKLADYLNINGNLLSRKHSENNTNCRKIQAPIRGMGINRSITPGIARETTFKDIRHRESTPIIAQRIDIQAQSFVVDNRILHKRTISRDEEVSSRNLNTTLNTSILNTTSRTHASPCRGNGEQFLSFITEDENVLNTERKLNNLNTFGLKTYKFAIKNGTFQIDEKGFVQLDIVKLERKLSISPDGEKIIVTKGNQNEEVTYELSKLPHKYHKYYEYACKVCEVIKSKIAKINMEDEEGKYYLLRNNSSIFEAKFKNGIKAKHNISSGVLRIDMNDGSVYEINTLGDTSYLGSFLSSIVHKTLEKMHLCLEKEKRKQ